MFDGEPSSKRMTQEVIRTLRESISEAKGREVFFAGTLDENGILVSVRVVGRGNLESVPALFNSIYPTEVVLHNHPTGDLEPSDPDLNIAHEFHGRGNSFYIINNDATRVYVVVEPFIPKTPVLIEERKVAQTFAPGGLLSKEMETFEVRPQQIEMAKAVASAFNNSTMSIIEAPTGVGKTMAYLLPAVLWALNNDERVVISTRTINLQEQIILKDIPFLRQCIKKEFRACLVKGRGNYVCLNKLHRTFAEISLLDDPNRIEQIKMIFQWAKKTQDGSISDLPFVPVKFLWESVCCERDICAGTYCNHFASCFLVRARQEMALAEILVVNHHILFADMTLKFGLTLDTKSNVLPKFRYLIFDEGHSIEDSATESFSLSTTRHGLYKTINRLFHLKKEQEIGLLPFLKARLKKNYQQLYPKELNKVIALIDKELKPACISTQEIIEDAFSALKEYVLESAGDVGKETIKWRVTERRAEEPDFMRLFRKKIQPAIDQTRELVHLGKELIEVLRKIQGEDFSRERDFLFDVFELEAYMKRLEESSNALEKCGHKHIQDHEVCWITIDDYDEDKVGVTVCPLDVGEHLFNFVYSNMNSVIITSATLAVQRSFEFAKARSGFNHVSEDQLQELLLDSPFDYESQCLLCVPTDTAEPSSPEYLEELVEHVRTILSVTKGHALILFTSFHALDYVYSYLEHDLRKKKIHTLCQGRDPRSRLLKEFREDPSSVLFATDSFWEGVDVAGDALQCVVLTRLPFRVPTDPIVEARAEAIRLEGGDPFLEYSLPQAVIKLRQGFGRLIRRSTDWGAVVVLDNRILNKRYGKVFLESLPQVTLVHGPADTVWEQLDHFFRARRKGKVH